MDVDIEYNTDRDHAFTINLINPSFKYTAATSSTKLNIMDRIEIALDAGSGSAWPLFTTSMIQGFVQDINWSIDSQGRQRAAVRGTGKMFPLKYHVIGPNQCVMREKDLGDIMKGTTLSTYSYSWSADSNANYPNGILYASDLTFAGLTRGSPSFYLNTGSITSSISDQSSFFITLSKSGVSPLAFPEIRFSASSGGTAVTVVKLFNERTGEELSSATATITGAGTYTFEQKTDLDPSVKHVVEITPSGSGITISTFSLVDPASATASKDAVLDILDRHTVFDALKFYTDKLSVFFIPPTTGSIITFHNAFDDYAPTFSLGRDIMDFQLEATEAARIRGVVTIASNDTVPIIYEYIIDKDINKTVSTNFFKLDQAPGVKGYNDAMWRASAVYRDSKKKQLKGSIKLPGLIHGEILVGKKITIDGTNLSSDMVGVGDVVRERHNFSADGRYTITLDLENRMFTVPDLVADRLAEQTRVTPRKNEDPVEREIASTYFTIETWSQEMSDPSTFSSSRTATFLLVGTGSSSTSMGIIYLTPFAQETLSDGARIYPIDAPFANGQLTLFGQVYQSSASDTTLSQSSTIFRRALSPSLFTNGFEMLLPNAPVFVSMPVLKGVTRVGRNFYKNWKPVHSGMNKVATNSNSDMPGWHGETSSASLWITLSPSLREKISIDDVYDPGTESTSNTISVLSGGHLAMEFRLYRAGLTNSTTSIMKGFNITCVAKATTSYSVSGAGSPTGSEIITVWTLDTASVTAGHFIPIGSLAKRNVLSNGWAEWTGSFSTVREVVHTVSGSPSELDATQLMVVVLSTRPTDSTVSIITSQFTISYVDVSIHHEKPDLATFSFFDIPEIEETYSLTASIADPFAEVSKDTIWNILKGKYPIPFRAIPTEITKIEYVSSRVEDRIGNPATLSETKTVNVNVPVVVSLTANDDGAVFQNGTLKGGDILELPVNIIGLPKPREGNWGDVVAMGVIDAGAWASLRVHHGRITRFSVVYKYKPFSQLIDLYLPESAVADDIGEDFTQVFDSNSFSNQTTMIMKHRHLDSAQRVTSYGSQFSFEVRDYGLWTSSKGSGSGSTWDVHKLYVDTVVGIEKTPIKRLITQVRADSR
jgi:hypothetical protein